MKLDRISASKTKTFDSCLFKFWIIYVLGEVPKSNWGAEHGSLLHTILEYLASGEDTNWLKNLFLGYRGEL